MLVFNSLSKSFGPVRVLDDINETFAAGRVHALVGANGAGKSTLIKIASGVHGGFEGQMTLNDAPFIPRDPRDAYAAGIRTLQQETDVNLYVGLSVAENFVLKTRGHTGLRRLVTSADRRDARTRLAKLGLGDINLDARISDFSLSMRQEIALACALDPKARVLILDEPTASIDQADVRTLLNSIRDLRNHGVAILFVSHHLAEVAAVADTVTILRGGALVESFDIDRDVMTEKAIVARIVSGMLGPKRAADMLARPTRPGPTDVPPALRFSDVTARGLQGVTLSVRPGEITVVTGLVGSGCDTVVRLAAGLARPTGGEIRVRETPVRHLSPRRAKAHGIGIVPADRARQGLHLDMTSAWNLTLPVLPESTGPTGILKRSDLTARSDALIRLLEIVGCTRLEPVRRLSGGNQQKIVLGKCLAHGPSILLLDEPTRGVDVGTRTQIYAKLRELAADGAAILCATTDHTEAIALGDIVHVLHRGHIAATLTGEAVTQDALARAESGGDL